MNTELTYWYNDIPKHWRIQELKYLCSTIGSGTTPNSGDDDFYPDEGGIHFLQTGDLNDGIVENTAKRISDVAVNKFGLRTYPKGSLVVAMYGATIGKLGILNFDTTVNQACCVIKTRQANIKYLFYALSASKPLLVLEAKGGGQPNINQDTLRNWRLLLPPIAYQQKIANYLDNKISNIDAYVSERKKERLLLSDLKKAKVAEIVTKGLSPNVPLKDSGIPSIGMIPAHWEVRRLKELFEFGSGLPISKADLLETGIPVISYGQIHAKFNRGTKVEEQLIRYVDPSYLETNPSSLVNKGDVIFADTSEDLEGCGNCVYIDKQMPLFAGYHTVILKCRKENPYLAYLFQSSNWREQIRKRVCGVKLYSITKTILNSVYVILPPIEEQIQIVEYLDHECEQIEKKCALIDKQIQQLQLLKRALINEVVTGKKAI